MTTITSKNVSHKNVKEALNNPMGFQMQDTPEVRKAVSLGVDDIIPGLHAKNDMMEVDGVYFKMKHIPISCH